MQRWMNWLHIKNLVADLDDGGLKDPDFRKMRNMLKPIHKAIMADGSPINLGDPAVSLFFKMIELGDAPETSLADAVRSLEVWNLINLQKPGMGLYDSPELEKLVNLRLVPNGWAELDRVIRQISEETLSAKAERLEGSIISNPADPGIDGPNVYTLNLLMMHDGSVYRENLALASSTSEALGLVGQVLEQQGQRYLQSGCYGEIGSTPVALYLKINDVIQFMAPVRPAKVVEPSDSGELESHDDHSDPQVDWAGITWQRHDRGIMKALADFLPKPLAQRVKGTFLSDELGM